MNRIFLKKTIHEAERQRALSHEARKMGLKVVCFDTFTEYLKKQKNSKLVTSLGVLAWMIMLFLLGCIYGMLNLAAALV